MVTHISRGCSGQTVETWKKHGLHESPMALREHVPAGSPCEAIGLGNPMCWVARSLVQRGCVKPEKNDDIKVYPSFC